MSWCSLSDIFHRLERDDQAIGAAFEAIQEQPDYPDAYFNLHDIYFNKGQYVMVKITSCTSATLLGEVVDVCATH
jgi:tetratricopeptide (TPR) repeat protein